MLKCKDIVRMYRREIAWERMAWVYVAQDRDQWWALVNTVMNLRIS
jgi:hypothetical protein